MRAPRLSRAAKSDAKDGDAAIAAGWAAFRPGVLHDAQHEYVFLEEAASKP